MKIGLSISPELLLGAPEKPGEKKLLHYFGTPFRMMESIKKRGVSSVELRTVKRDQEPGHFIDLYKMIWEAGLEISVHGHMEGNFSGNHFEQVYPSISYILENYARYQQSFVMTLHPYFSLDGVHVEELSNQTAATIREWRSMVEKQDINVKFALELNRLKKGKEDPGNTVDGLLKLMEKIKDRRVGICWDMGHFYSNLQNEDHASNHSLPITSFLEQTIHTHIHGLSQAGQTHFPLLSESDLPLQAYVQALKQAGYAGVYNLELDSNRFADDPEMVEKYLKSIDRLITCVK